MTERESLRVTIPGAKVLPPAPAQEPPASLQVKRVLLEKGYRMLGRFYVQGHPDAVKTLTYYARGEERLLLEVTEDTHSRAEVGCELYRPVAETKSLAAMLAAIP